MTDEPLIHDPGNETQIGEVFVFMSIDDKGKNGIVASIYPALGASGPLVTSSAGVAEYMKGLAQEVADRTGKRVGMFRFVRDGQLWRSE
jgi:hypothetical protein